MKRNTLSAALVGLMAAAIPAALPAVATLAPQIVQAASQAPATPRAPAPVANVTMASFKREAEPLPYVAPFSTTTQFYANVPRFRGYRNGRPRGRRSYRSQQRS